MPPTIADPKDILAEAKERIVRQGCDPVPDNLQDLVDEVWCTIEECLGCPPCLEADTVTIPGNGLDWLELPPECVLCIDQVTMREGKDGTDRDIGWAWEPPACLTRSGGSAPCPCSGGGCGSCCSSPWPIGCYVTVHYQAGIVDPKKHKILRAIAIDAVVAAAKQCSSDGVKSYSIGSLSKTFFDHRDATGTGHLTGAQVARVKQCRR